MLLDLSKRLFHALNMEGYSEIVFAAFIASFAIMFALRAATFLAYQAQNALFKISATEIKKRDDIKNTRSGILNKTMRDYIRAGAKGSGAIDAAAITDRHMRALSFFGWRFYSVEDFLGYTRVGLIVIGVFLAVTFEDYRFAYCSSTAGLFIISAFLSSVFDISAVREQLLRDVSEYVRREVGQFYAKDMVSATSVLKKDLTESIDNLSARLTEAVGKMSANAADMFKMGVAEALGEPADLWRQAAIDAARAQNDVNKAGSAARPIVERLEKALQRADAAAAEQTRIYASSAAILAENMAALSNAASRLEKITSEFEASIKTENAAVKSQLYFVEKNQTALAESLSGYETSLKALANDIGGALGGLIAIQARESYDEINERLSENIRIIIMSNAELAAKIQNIFDDFLKRSKTGTKMNGRRFLNGEENESI